jgi:hypothetical protein
MTKYSTLPTRIVLMDLSTTCYCYMFLDPTLITAFVESWHEETSSFHMLSRKSIMTLDDVS